ALSDITIPSSLKMSATRRGHDILLITVCKNSNLPSENAHKLLLSHSSIRRDGFPIDTNNPPLIDDHLAAYIYFINITTRCTLKKKPDRVFVANCVRAVCVQDYQICAFSRLDTSNFLVHPYRLRTPLDRHPERLIGTNIIAIVI